MDCLLWYLDNYWEKGELMRYLIATLLLAVSATFGWAHGGGTDANGCHQDHKNGGYHCH